MTVSPPWTEEDDAKAKKLAENGTSYAEIGKILGRTKNSVSGRMSRIKFAKPLKEEHERRRVVSNIIADKKAKERAKTMIENLNFKEPKTIQHPLHMRRITIDDLTYRSCRFPLGESHDPDLRYCGEDAMLGSSWCSHHRRIVFVPKAPPKRISTYKSYR